MDNKYRNKREICRTSVFNDTANKEYPKENYTGIQRHTLDNSSEEVVVGSCLENLKILAEEEFIHQYDRLPSCVVFAPETLTLVGEGTDFAESKSLCMAVQLGTVIAGKLNNDSKWCHVRILSNDSNSKTFIRFRLNEQNLERRNEEAKWIQYVKGTIRSFMAKQGYIPGFKCVIVSSTSLKRELERRNSLVVAVYTFLEAITNRNTRNAFEKALHCHLALKSVGGRFAFRLVDTLISVLGLENTIFFFDAHLLQMKKCYWPSEQVSLVLIDTENEIPIRTPSTIHWKAIATALNSSNRWQTRPVDIPMLEALFPEDVIRGVEDKLAEDDRVVEAMKFVENKRWKELGELFWENYRSTRESAASLCCYVEHMMSALKVTEGVLGAKLLSRGYGASILVLVQRSCLKTVVHTLNRIKSSRHDIVKASIGASILYAREDRSVSPDEKTSYQSRVKFRSKYHLSEDIGYNYEYQRVYEPANGADPTSAHSKEPLYLSIPNLCECTENFHYYIRL